MVMFSTVDCVQEGPIDENLSVIDGGITAKVKLRCAWEDRLLLADDLLLNMRPWPYITTSFTPVALSCSATWTNSNAKAVTDGQGYYPEYAYVTVNYGIPKVSSSSIGSFDLISETLEPGGSFIRLPYTLFRWGSRTGDPIEPDESPGVFVPALKLVRRIYRLASLPGNALSSVSKCNANSYASPLLGVTFAPETLLYLEPVTERTISTAGTEGWNYTQNWEYNPNGWNKYYRAKTQTWEEIYRVDTTGTPTPFKSYVPDALTGLLL